MSLFSPAMGFVPAPITKSFRGYKEHTNDATTYTDSSVDLSGYDVIVVFVISRGSNPVALTTSTIGGRAVSRFMSETNVIAYPTRLAATGLIVRRQPGDGDEIVINFDSTSQYCGYVVYGLNNVQSISPVSSNEQSPDNTTTIEFDAINTRVGGCSLVFAASTDDNRFMSFSGDGLSENFDDDIDAEDSFGSASVLTSTEATGTYTVSDLDSSHSHVGLAVHFR